MKAYQRTFGVEWDDNEIDEAPIEKQNEYLTSNAPRRTKLNKIRSQRRTAGKIDQIKDPHGLSDQHEHLLRIERVRKKCQLQNEALSMWYKAAIQSHFQQRMWMQLGQSPPESMLPPRFERLYQPDKIAQFDRFFARAWATPVRRSHSAQQGGANDSGSELAEFRKSISGRLNSAAAGGDRTGAIEISPDDGSETLLDYTRTHGFGAQVPPSLKKFIEPHLALCGGLPSKQSNGKVSLKTSFGCLLR
jgi:hypothetical protein